MPCGQFRIGVDHSLSPPGSVLRCAVAARFSPHRYVWTGAWFARVGTCFEQVGSWRVGPCFSSHDPSQMRGLPTLLLSRDGHLASIAQFPKSTHDGQWWDCRQRNGNWCFDSSMFFSRDDDFQRQFGPGCGGWETRNSTRWLRDVANVLASGLQLGRQGR